MPIIATDTNRLSSVLQHEYEPTLGFCRDVVTVNEASALTYPVGTVLGKITASGKYIRVEATAVDGSAVAAAVVIGDSTGKAGDVTIPATTDTKVLVLTRGPAMVKDAGLTFGSTVDTTNEKNAAYAQLAALGILVQTAV